MFEELQIGTRQAHKKKVVILGGGFAGLKTAKILCRRLSPNLRKRVEVLLINKTNFHLFTPLLYQASTGLVDMDAIAQPIRPQAAREGFEFLEGEIKSVNLQAQTVHLQYGYVPYDYLVIALGTVKDDRKIEGASKYAIPLKTLEDGKRIHNRIVQSFERAALLPKGPERDGLLTFVVIGGSTGVELAGSIVDYVKAVARLYPMFEPKRDCHIVVIEAGDRLFPGGDSSLSGVVKESLERRGVQIFLETRVEKIDHTRIWLSNGETICSANIFDNSGVVPNPVNDTIPEDLVKKEHGKLIVDPFLRIPNFENVFAIGDCSAVITGHHKNGKPSYAPPTAESAVEEGEYVAKYIARDLSSVRFYGNGNTRRSSSYHRQQSEILDRSDALPPKAHPFRYREKGTMISIGSHTGVAKFPNFTLTGVLGWLIWRVVHLYLIATARGKLSVGFDWILDLFGESNTSEVP